MLTLNLLHNLRDLRKQRIMLLGIRNKWILTFDGKLELLDLKLSSLIFNSL